MVIWYKKQVIFQASNKIQPFAFETNASVRRKFSETYAILEKQIE